MPCQILMLRCQSRKQEWHQIPLDTFDLLHQRNCVGHFSLFLNCSASKLLNLSLTSALSFSVRSSFIEAALNVHCQAGKKKNTMKHLILKKQRVISDRGSAFPAPLSCGVGFIKGSKEVNTLCQKPP